jgi:hypothetical protein
VIRVFDAPDQPYGAGHRGIDIGAPVGTIVLAPDAGLVTFAGPVGGRLFVTIDHGDGLLSTSSWLSSVLVQTGQQVVRGQPIATTGWGHADATIPHVHFGVRLDGVYVDPLDYLEPLDVSSLIRLAPLSGAAMRPPLGRIARLAYPTSLAPAGRMSGPGADPGGLRTSRVGRGMAAVPGGRRPIGLRRSRSFAAVCACVADAGGAR